MSDIDVDGHLHRAAERHMESLEERELRDCDVCEERCVDDDTDTCLGCGAERCGSCGVMSQFVGHLDVDIFAVTVVRRERLACCDECAACNVALPRFLAWLEGSL